MSEPKADSGSATPVGAGLVLRGVLRTLGRPLLLNATALSVAVGIPAAILFSANGLRAEQVVALSHHSWFARAALWAGWFMLSAPALSALFDAPGSRTLRALRLPRAPLIGSLCVLALLPQLPWAILFVRGAGVGAGWAAATLAIALAASSITARRRASFWGVVLLGALFLSCDPPAWAGALCGSLWAPFAVHAAWRRALEQPRVTVRLTRPTHPVFALYIAHSLRLLRVARSRLMAALVMASTGCIGLVYSLRNDPAERPVQRALAAMALPLTLSAAACCAPVIESEARLRSLLRSLRVPRVFVLAAFLLAIATPSSALAATTGIAASSACHGSTVLLGVTLLAWAVSLSSAVAMWARLLERRARRSAGTFAAGVTLIAALALVSALSW